MVLAMRPKFHHAQLVAAEDWLLDDKKTAGRQDFDMSKYTEKRDAQLLRRLVGGLIEGCHKKEVDKASATREQARATFAPSARLAASSARAPSPSAPTRPSS